LWKPLSQGTMMVDLGVPEVFVGQIAQFADGLVHTQSTAPNLLKHFFDLVCRQVNILDFNVCAVAPDNSGINAPITTQAFSIFIPPFVSKRGQDRDRFIWRGMGILPTIPHGRDARAAGSLIVAWASSP
ncbi:MAG: hypothetical protein KGM47_12615, partial [Acidobacteriota bacterium]|nr:hypothetical protein [Acidobacteriota bacterium]